MFAELLGHELKLLQVLQALREYHIGAGINICLAPFYGAFDALDPPSIGPGTYYKFAI